MAVTITIERDDDDNVTVAVAKNGELRYVDHIEKRYSYAFLSNILRISKLFSPPDTDDE